jgi:glycine/D-amino acid oxidase-like deaminating enzyme
MDEGGPLPIAEADVVVIGAGAFGLSAAFHLAELGGGRVVVLDRFEPASQTSPRAAGLFKAVQADRTLVELARRSIALVEGFAAATGVPLPHVRSGSLLLARTPEHAAFVRGEAERARGWGVELEPVEPADVPRLAPYLAADGVLAAYHVPGDIYVEEPATLLAAFRAAGERRGVTVVGHAPVTEVRVRGGRVVGVGTPRGAIRTETVVDAAGAWAPAVGELAGVRVPVAPVRHQLRITAPLGGVAAEHPIARIVDASVYLRPARGGLMVGGMETDPLPLDPRRAGPGFTMADVPLEAAVLDRLAASVADTAPALREAPTAEHRGGLFTMTPDARFLVGPAPGVGGLWLATGCNGSGFSLSAAIGRALAEWIVGGQPELDIAALDPARFAGRPLDEAGLVAAGVHNYASYYADAALRA